MTLIRSHFESLEAALQAAGQTYDGWPANEKSSQRQSRDKTAACGSKDWAEAQSLALNGWAEGLQKISLQAEAIKANASGLGLAPSFTLDLGGAYPMAPLAAAGDDMCMVNLAPSSERARPVLRLACMTVASSLYDPSDFFSYGASLLAIIDALESADFQIELTAVISAESRRTAENFLCTIVIKEAGHALDLSKLAFVLCHASWLRRVGFGLFEAALQFSRWGDNYGIPWNPPIEYFDHDQILLPSLQQWGPSSQQLRSPEACYKAMLPSVSALLADRYADFPALAIIDKPLAA